MYNNYINYNTNVLFLQTFFILASAVVNVPGL